ncbi:MAG TPA: hypothetical protein VFN80_04410 [Acidothermaceae bacterium]|jgi:hypothetical protein|nr:hypothetical protein [Acidothermaceae bacterium]
MSEVTLHEVRLLGVPMALHAAAQEHSAELMREMYLIAQQLHASGADGIGEHLPVRLVELVEALTGEFSGMTVAQDRQLEDAVASGVASIDLIYQIPAAAGAAAQHLGGMLDEADEYCRAGQHLLTLATPPELLRYRQWYLGEFVRQLAGEPPTPWSEY